MSTNKPRVLCMLNLTGAAEGVSELQEVADVVILPPDRERLLEMVSELDAVWTHTDLKIDTLGVIS